MKNKYKYIEYILIAVCFILLGYYVAVDTIKLDNALGFEDERLVGNLVSSLIFFMIGLSCIFKK